MPASAGFVTRFLLLFYACKSFFSDLASVFDVALVLQSFAKDKLNDRP